jgi:hypothetical protein
MKLWKINDTYIVTPVHATAIDAVLAAAAGGVVGIETVTVVRNRIKVFDEGYLRGPNRGETDGSSKL